MANMENLVVVVVIIAFIAMVGYNPNIQPTATAVMTSSTANAGYDRSEILSMDCEHNVICYASGGISSSKSCVFIDKAIPECAG